MSERKVNKFEAMNFLVNVLGDRDVPVADQPNQKALQSVHALFAGAGKGAELAAVLANIDREVLGADDVQILECKTAGMNGARLWRDGVPEYVQLQVQHQLAVTGKQAADVACLICGNELRVYRIDRDEELIEKLIDLEAQFWSLVETRQAPAPDGSESAGAALRALYPRDAGSTVDYTGDLAMGQLFSHLLDARAALDAAQVREAELKQRIQQAMGEATKAVFEAGEVTWKRSADATAVDTARLLKDRPEGLS